MMVWQYGQLAQENTWKQQVQLTGMVVDVEDIWQKQVMITGSVVDVMPAWDAKETIRDVVISSTAVWISQDRISDAAVNSSKPWVKQQKLDGVVIDVAVGVPPAPPEEEKAKVNWWPLVIFGVVSAIAMVVAARRG